ncbi:amidohydrolase family protein [Cnuibacter physcomitrellae]|uniref:metal-dependent hydrolase family protein n=1 Tax=Cnuibacter physcomitrellae TaxID=1619308 RepID=UPI002175A25E|nr:amidohydrolase family protein [Cnuibacter physcomitrellae]MCS5495676.1 amidohydrolase family protein [Cnuibacter physcomitrellae]
MRIENVEVWDGERTLGVGSVEWSVADGDGTITGVSAVASASGSASGAAGTGASGAAGAGLSVIPGLIDTHVHLIGYAGRGHADFLSWPLTTRPEEQVLHGLAHAQAALRGGVTTLRDLSADEIQFSLARAVNSGLIEGPRLLAHGMVSMTAGHGDLFTPAAFPLRKPTADGPDECRKLVRQWARAGADGIKIATSGGVLSVGDKASWRNHTRAEIDAIVDEAHALSMPVAAHAHTAEGIDIALDAGVDSIEHGTLIGEEQAARIAASGVTVAPTLLINDRIASGERAVSPEQSAKAAELVSRRDALMRAAADAGVDFVLGTDANGHHVDFGDQMAEVRAMAGVFGWSADRALQSATSRAAAAIGRGSSLGRLAPGYAADLVVLRGRPWDDLGALDVSRIVAVVSRGRVVAGALPA